MPVLKIRHGNDDVLRMKASMVYNIDSAVREILQEMMNTLNASKGVGLAANQVGILKRIIVINFMDTRLKLVNPKIISLSGTRKSIEGCLSFPGMFGVVRRPKNITVNAYDEFGQRTIFEAHDDMAKCICHEIDHLDGILFMDRMIDKPIIR